MADEKRDLFGRTEAELVAAIDQGERIYKISSAWTGKELLGINLANKRRNIEVDRRCLARLRGERVTPPEDWRPDLEGDALKKWRANILYMGRR